MVSQQNPLPYQKTEQASRKVGFAELSPPRQKLCKHDSALGLTERLASPSFLRLGWLRRAFSASAEFKQA